MDIQEFDNQLCQLKRREPFQPFEVELLDGRVIQILCPRLAINWGGATFVSDDDELVDFQCDQVVSIHPILSEAAR